MAHNDSHLLRRQAMNVAHEQSNGILGRPPSSPLNETGCRNLGSENEIDANCLSPAILAPEEAPRVNVMRLAPNWRQGCRQPSGT